MDGLKQIAVVSTNMTGPNEILGLRGDGALFRGQVSVEQGGKVSIVWTEISETTRK